MSTEFFLRIVRDDAPPMVGLHDQTSPYLLDTLHFGSDYYQDFAAYVRAAIQECMLDGSINYESSVITIDKIERVSVQAKRFLIDKSWFAYVSYTAETLPKQAQPYDEKYLENVLIWLRKHAGRRVVGFVW